jgi:hypothetical protein
LDVTESGLPQGLFHDLLQSKAERTGQSGRWRRQLRASVDDADRDRKEAVGLRGREARDRHPSVLLQDPAHLPQCAKPVREVHQPEAGERNVERGIVEDQMLPIHSARLELTRAKATLTSNLGGEAQEVHRSVRACALAAHR